MDVIQWEKGEKNTLGPSLVIGNRVEFCDEGEFVVVCKVTKVLQRKLQSRHLSSYSSCCYPCLAGLLFPLNRRSWHACVRIFISQVRLLLYVCSAGYSIYNRPDHIY